MDQVQHDGHYLGPSSPMAEAPRSHWPWWRPWHTDNLQHIPRPSRGRWHFEHAQSHKDIQIRGDTQPYTFPSKHTQGTFRHTPRLDIPLCNPTDSTVAWPHTRTRTIGSLSIAWRPRGTGPEGLSSERPRSGSGHASSAGAALEG